MVGDFFRTVIGDVADDDPVPPGRGEVHVIEADPGADHALAARGRGERGLADPGDVVEEEDRIGLGDQRP